MECDPSIKSLIVKLDSVGNDYIIEDLDDGHLVIHEKMVAVLKGKLNDVGSCSEHADDGILMW